QGILYNVAMMYMISELVVNEKFRHSVLPVMMFDIPTQNLFSSIPDFQKHMDSEKIQQDNKQMYCLVTEHFFEMVTMSEYLNSHANTMNSKKWKVLFFQIIYAIYKLQERFDNFRHNNLNLNAIKIYLKETNSTKTYNYKVGDSKFIIPDQGFDIKITDYDYSNTNDYVKNIITSNNLVNPYFDVHFVFYEIQQWITGHKIIDQVPDDIKQFLRLLVPDEIKVVLINDVFKGMDETQTDNMNIITNRLMSVPSMILKKNNLFQEFIHIEGGMSMSASPIQDKSITESDSENPRLLGKKISSPRKKSNHNINRMPRNSNKTRSKNIRNNSDQDDQTNSDDSDDILLKAESQFRKAKKNNNHRKNRQVTSGREKYFKAVRKSGSQSKTALSDDDISSEDTMSAGTADYDEYLRNISRLEKANKKKSMRKKQKRSQVTSKHASNKHSVSSNSNSSFGDKFAQKLKELPENFVGEVPPHLLHLLTNENEAGSQNPQMMPEHNSKNEEMKQLLGMSNVPNNMPQMPPSMRRNSLPNGTSYPSGSNIPQMPNIPNGMMEGQMEQPSAMPSGMPAGMPMGMPMGMPTGMPMGMPMGMPTGMPTGMPMGMPSGMPAGMPMEIPSGMPSGVPNSMPMDGPMGIPAGMPSMQGMPNMPSMQGMPNMPSMPNMPNMPSMQGISSMPSMPSIPSMPSMPSMQSMQGMYGIQPLDIQQMPPMNPMMNQMGGGKKYCLKKNDKNFFF
ncbi:MAG: hypothetical protein Dasosvirus2_1, partial [Dasosvirus sp.]